MADGPSAGSLARQARLEHLMAASLPRSPADVMAILADHGPAPSTICLHPDPAGRDGAEAAGSAATGRSRREVAGADDDEAEAVLFAMVCDLEAGRIWVAPGRPCEARFEAFDLADLLAGT